MAVVGKYDTYKGSTHVVVTNSVDNPDEGNMILIKDRHMKELSTSISVLLFWEI